MTPAEKACGQWLWTQLDSEQRAEAERLFTLYQAYSVGVERGKFIVRPSAGAIDGGWMIDKPHVGKFQ
jgi:hypothetical protein